MSEITPGWYKDPADPDVQRYWDGEGWLGDPIPAGSPTPIGPPEGATPEWLPKPKPKPVEPPVAPPPAAPAPPPAAPAPPPPPRRRRRTHRGCPRPHRSRRRKLRSHLQRRWSMHPGFAAVSGRPDPARPGRPDPARPGNTDPAGSADPGCAGRADPAKRPESAVPGNARHAVATRRPVAARRPTPPWPSTSPGHRAAARDCAAARSHPAAPGAPVPPGLFPGDKLPPGAIPVLLPGPVPSIVSIVPTALAHGMPIAPMWSRFLARIIDIFVVLGLNVVVNGWFAYQYWKEIYPKVAAVFRASMAGDKIEPLTTSSRLSYLEIVIIVLAAALWFAYEVPSIAGNGQTLGKRVMRIKVVRQESTDPVGFGRAIRRWNPLGLPTLMWYCGIGFLFQIADGLSPLFDWPLRRALHDRSAGTVVVRVPRTEQSTEQSVKSGGDQ